MQSVWMKVMGERGRSALYTSCVYMPTNGSGTATIDDSYSLLNPLTPIVHFWASPQTHPLSLVHKQRIGYFSVCYFSVCLWLALYTLRC